jgi:hypothetical protein
MLTDTLIAIETAALEAVTGGRLDAGPKTASPQTTQALAQCSQAFVQGCQQIAQAKQAEGQGMQQVLGQALQSKMGGGGGGH